LFRTSSFPVFFFFLLESIFFFVTFFSCVFSVERSFVLLMLRQERSTEETELVRLRPSGLALLSWYSSLVRLWFFSCGLGWAGWAGRTTPEDSLETLLFLTGLGCLLMEMDLSLLTLIFLEDSRMV
jgi:hypothetical protein